MDSWPPREMGRLQLSCNYAVCYLMGLTYILNSPQIRNKKKKTSSEREETQLGHSVIYAIVWELNERLDVKTTNAEYIIHPPRIYTTKCNL